MAEHDEPISPKLEESDPPWLKHALTHQGCRELTPNGGLNPVVRDFFKVTSFPPSLINLRTAWCAAFACTCLEVANYRSPRSASAKAFLTWGNEQVKLRRGAICVFTRGEASAATGHVGFYVGDAPNGDLLVLGGNQGNCVSVQRYPRSRLMAVRWPSEKLRAGA